MEAVNTESLMWKHERELLVAQRAGAHLSDLPPINQLLKTVQAAEWEEIFSICHQLYGSGNVLKMTDRWRMEGSGTAGKEEEKSDTEEGHWKLTDGSSEIYLYVSVSVHRPQGATPAFLLRERKTQTDGQ